MEAHERRALPEGWEWKKLENICKVKGGYAFKSDEFTKSGITVIRISNFNDGELDITNCVFINSDLLNQFDEYKLADGDILIAMSGATTGKIGIVKQTTKPLLLNQRVGKFSIFNDCLDNKFLYYFVKGEFFKKEVLKFASGCAQPNVSSKQIESIKIPLPPLPTQRRIVSILEKAEETTRLRAQADELTDRLLQSVFLELFYKNNPDYDNWDCFSIHNLSSPEKGSMRTGPFGSNLKHSEFVSSGIAVLGIDNVVNNQFQWAQRRYITEEKYKELKCYTVYPNDVLITIMATIGKSCVVPKDLPLSISTKHLAVITCDESKCDPQFLSFSILFHPEIKLQMTKANIGAIMDGLNLKIIRALKIHLPPLPLQQKFARIVEKVESMGQSQNQSKQQIEDLFSALMQKAFRGEI